jgi:hypothetical protein
MQWIIVILGMNASVARPPEAEGREGKYLKALKLFRLTKLGELKAARSTGPQTAIDARFCSLLPHRKKFPRNRRLCIDVVRTIPIKGAIRARWTLDSMESWI